MFRKVTYGNERFFHEDTRKIVIIWQSIVALTRKGSHTSWEMMRKLYTISYRRQLAIHV